MLCFPLQSMTFWPFLLIEIDKADPLTYPCSLTSPFSPIAVHVEIFSPIYVLMTEFVVVDVNIGPSTFPNLTIEVLFLPIEPIGNGAVVDADNGMILC